MAVPERFEGAVAVKSSEEGKVGEKKSTDIKKDKEALKDAWNNKKVKLFPPSTPSLFYDGEKALTKKKKKKILGPPKGPQKNC